MPTLRSHTGTGGDVGGTASPAQDINLPSARDTDGKGQAILFADVCKSMVLHEKLGDNEARVVIDNLLELAKKAVRAHKGRVVKNIGDEILAVLPTADAAARAARDLLMAVDLAEQKGGIKPQMHVGLHAGEFLEKEGDVFGDAVNVAARLTSYAQQGQILTTSASAAGISPLVRRAMRKLGPLELRGRQEEIQVEEIQWREGGDGEATYTEIAPQRQSSSLELRLHERKWIVGPKAKHLSIGRDAGSDIPIDSSKASRNHGMIEYRNGGFFYIDMSLNGSYVSFGSTEDTRVRRSQVLLSGRGLICFGHPTNEPGDRLEFHVDTAES